MASEKEVVDELYKLVDDAANPREARVTINKKFPDWDSREKLRRIIPKVERRFPAIKRTQFRKTAYFKIFLIGPDDLRARGKKIPQIY